MSWHPQPIGELARREMARFGPAGALGDLVAAWPDAVGPAIAANAWPARVARDGVLHVATSSSAWAFELTQLAADVAERLRAHLGDLAPPSLRFAVGPLPEPPARPVEEAARSVPEVPPEAQAEGTRLAAPIADPELRELVARAAAASLARAAREGARPGPLVD